MFRYEDYKKPKVKREPLFTLPEIADRLGVDYDNLRVCMHTSKAEGYPKSEIDSYGKHLLSVGKIFD